MKNPFRLKRADKDLTSDMMPKTRRAVFFDVLKLHWKEFLMYGILVLLFTLPMHILTVFEDVRTSILLQNFSALGEEEQLAINANLASLSNMKALLFIPLLMLFSVVLSGMMRVVRQFAWEENVYFKYEFFLGIKQNIKQTLPICLLVGLFNYVSNVVSLFGGIYSDGAKTVIMLIPMAILWIIIIPTSAYTLVSVSVYSNKLRGNLKVGVILLSGNVIKTYLAYILCLLPFTLSVIPNIMCHIIGAVIGSLAFPFVLLGWYLHTYELLDKNINKDHYPELVGRGTFKDQ